MNLLQPRWDIDDFIVGNEFPTPVKMMKMPVAEMGLAQLQDSITRLKLKDEWLRPYICFNSQTYQRQLLIRNSLFEILLLCWQPGQTSSIHDHANSLNVTRVYQGVLTSRTFKTDLSSKQESVLKLQSEDYLEKDELATVDRYNIHQLGNTSPENLITLHFYSKPLQNIRVYSPIF